MRRRNLMAMGFAGGMVPSPSALVVLLGSIALGRAWFGFLLITAYGLGMAATLVTAGLVIARARSRFERLLANRSSTRFARAAGALPVLTAVLVVLGGILITARALTA
jgi:ABC-type nickel/cobalt efflux system permease component RcnA